MRQGDWVLTESSKAGTGRRDPHGGGSPSTSSRVELFHVKEDLGETKNLYQQYPNRVKQMHALREHYKNE
jgi:hypothetical protein